LLDTQFIESRRLLDESWILGQGTIYPDTIESGGTAKAALIKTHHNRVAGIQKLIAAGRIVEPLKSFYKDEVRAVGREIALAGELLDRHPFPGPGLAIRCLCAESDAPLVPTAEGFIVPIHSVGVQGDSRTYAPVLAIDGLDHARATELINSIGGVNRVIAPVETRVPVETMKVRACGLTAERLERRSPVFALGGVVTGEIAGFAAATYLRGLPLIQIPTSPIAQVDTSIGGKVAVNLPEGKNLVGAFYQPRQVITDVEALVSLPARDFRAGLAEVVKIAAIRDRDLFEYLEKNVEEVLSQDLRALVRFVRRACEIKASIVEADEWETDVRSILNFGHTVGHAIEAETGYTRYLHGEAVGLGMQAAAWLSLLAARCSAEVARQIIDSVNLYGPLPSAADLLPERLLARLAQDKKTLRGTVHFVLATAIGSTEVVSGLDDSLVIEALRKVLK